MDCPLSTQSRRSRQRRLSTHPRRVRARPAEAEALMQDARRHKSRGALGNRNAGRHRGYSAKAEPAARYLNELARLMR